jgi:hypothetical protein
MCTTRISTESKLGLFLLLCPQGGSATIRSAMLVLIATLLAVSPLPIRAAAPDSVLEWIGVMNDTVLAAHTAPNVTSRIVALVSASVFDAVNGIEPRFRPLLVKPDAPHGASQRAAAIQAAYAILLNLYPAQSGTLTTRRDASVAALASGEKAEDIAAGVAWGQKVANAVWAARLTDGFNPAPPPFIGVQGLAATAADGFWRPTPPANAFGATPQIATMTPWVLTRPSQFRLPPPLERTSAEYAADLNEVKDMGSLSSVGTDRSKTALFWALNTPLAWDRIAAQISTKRGLTLTENAHLFALLNVSLSDALIACWDSKYRYVFWRPITAIRAGLTPADADPTWEPLLDSLRVNPGTPAHPEYPSAHSSLSGAAAFILAAAFGENTTFTATSEILPDSPRTYSSFSDATAEIADARVFGGIHFRTSCVRANKLGRAVAEYVSRHAMRARGDDREDDRD